MWVLARVVGMRAWICGSNAHHNRTPFGQFEIDPVRESLLLADVGR